MKADFFSFLTYILVIMLIIPGTISSVASAVDEEPADSGNLDSEGSNLNAADSDTVDSSSDNENLDTGSEDESSDSDNGGSDSDSDDGNSDSDNGDTDSDSGDSDSDNGDSDNDDSDSGSDNEDSDDGDSDSDDGNSDDEDTDDEDSDSGSNDEGSDSDNGDSDDDSDSGSDDEDSDDGDSGSDDGDSNSDEEDSDSDNGNEDSDSDDKDSDSSSGDNSETGDSDTENSDTGNKGSSSIGDSNPVTSGNGNSITQNSITQNSINVSSGTESSDSGSSSTQNKSSNSSSDSSSSSGWGMNLLSSEPASNIAVKELVTRSVINGYPVRFDFVENVTCVTCIEFDPKKTFRKTTTIVEELKNKSTLVPTPPSGTVYKHVNIWVGDKGAGLPTSIRNGVIEFKVEKSWIKDQSINESLITLQRYDEDWQPLYTEKVREDSNYVYFATETPGYSFFAITEYDGKNEDKEGIRGADKLHETLRNLGSEGRTALSGNAEKGNSRIKNPMGAARILMAISLPLFMLLVGYFLLKKKI